MRLRGGAGGVANHCFDHSLPAAVAAVARVIRGCALAAAARSDASAMLLVPPGLCCGLLRCQPELRAMSDGFQRPASCVTGQPCRGQVRMGPGCYVGRVSCSCE